MTVDLAAAVPLPPAPDTDGPPTGHPAALGIDTPTPEPDASALPPAPPPPVNELVQDVEHAVRLAVVDLEAALCPRTVAALVRLKLEAPPTFMRLRAALKRANPDLSAPGLDRMVDEAAGGDADRGDGAAEREAGGVEAIVAQVQSLGELFIGDDDAPYVRFARDGHREVWALDSRGLREWVGHVYYRETGRVPRAAQLADAFNTLAGTARHEGETHPVHLRVAVDPAGGYLIDIGDPEWRVIRVTDAGWQVLDDSPVRFRRTRGMQALPTPANDGTLDDLLALVNVRRADALLVVAVVLECYRADTAYPVVEWRGEEGSAKSTSAANLRRLVDPSAVLLRANPKNVEDVYVAARQNHVLNFNNLSTLSGAMQDALCNVSTGGGFATRKLYTDDEEAVHDAKRPVFMNGIPTLATQSDLLSRVVLIECPKLGDALAGGGAVAGGAPARVSDADMAARLEHHGPRALRFLLDTFSAALAVLPDVTLDAAPRLMDFTRLGEAVGRVLGHDPGAFTARYTAALRAAAVQSLESSPVIEALVSYVRARGPVNETVGELLHRLDEHAGTRRDTAWPKTAKGLADAMRRAAPALRALGIAATFGDKGNTGRRVTVRVLSAVEDANPPARPSPPSPPSRMTGESDGRDARDGAAGTLTSAAKGEVPPSAPSPVLRDEVRL